VADDTVALYDDPNGCVGMPTTYNPLPSDCPTVYKVLFVGVHVIVVTPSCATIKVFVPLPAVNVKFTDVWLSAVKVILLACGLGIAITNAVRVLEYTVAQ
jgi:hypothetical protein